jgi:hypothetical protein
MHKPSPKLTAALAAPISAATGIVTNLLTDKWQWGVAAALGILVLASALLAVQTAGQSRQKNKTQVSQTALDRSRIRGSHIQASTGSNVSETARNDSTIEASFIKADSADVARVADNGDIKGSSIDAG